MQAAFELLYRGRLELPDRSLIKIGEHDATSLTMPVYAAHFGHICIKVINAFNRNPGIGLDRVHGLLLLFDGRNGKPLAMLEGLSVTAIRTGAASGLATDLMARSDSASVAIVGAGVQGMAQLEAVCKVRSIKNARVYDIDAKAASRFADEMSHRLELEIVAADSAEEAVIGADIVCTATVSRTPVFEGQAISPGSHINAIGSFKPDHQEIPEETLMRSRLIVDHRTSVLSETGDLIVPIEKGIMKQTHIAGELGDLVIGNVVARENDRQITLFKSVGSAIQDLAAATAVFKNAEVNDTGITITL